MSHIRTQLRDAVVARLRAGGDFGLVEPRLRMLRGVQSDLFPLAFVSVSDSAIPVGKNPPGQRPLQRQIVVNVQVLQIADVEELDEKLDALAAKVEETLTDPATLDFGKVLDWTYVGTSEPTELEAEEQGTSSLRVTFRGIVTTKEGSPSTNIH
ncbi:hypothetical protein [Rhizobium sp. LCM 4573]|uniref:hypothetical protein n=1 Tax=Rhizobium sp. LCM 4573 TaxID=1848291 RepID=UPI0008DA55E1|nr:hypothetical protein [Rhizobium sp. LCM 4573]OHV83651.1 hypothetical protein LCM4573_05975 [Rhizobium sp. LCM 4573]